MIVIYFDPSKERGKQWGFHVYRPGWLLDANQSKVGFEDRLKARDEAIKIALSHPLGHQILE